jgi:hypothetical protein
LCPQSQDPNDTTFYRGLLFAKLEKNVEELKAYLSEIGINIDMEKADGILERTRKKFQEKNCTESDLVKVAHEHGKQLDELRSLAEMKHRFIESLYQQAENCRDITAHLSEKSLERITEAEDEIRKAERFDQIEAATTTARDLVLENVSTEFWQSRLGISMPRNRDDWRLLILASRAFTGLDKQIWLTRLDNEFAESTFDIVKILVGNYAALRALEEDPEDLRVNPPGEPVEEITGATCNGTAITICGDKNSKTAIMAALTRAGKEKIGSGITAKKQTTYIYRPEDVATVIWKSKALKDRMNKHLMKKTPKSIQGLINLIDRQCCSTLPKVLQK